MAIKELQTRIALKYDSYSAWTSAPGKDLVLLKGELGICYIGDTNPESNVVPTVLFKVGDGTKTFEKLPWASAKAADVYSWAKASEVKLVGKKLTFVGGGADGSDLEVPFDYVTLTEVKEITDGLASRIEVLEGKFTGDGSVGAQIEALDGRLDTLEGADSVEGSVANAIKVAKAYTDAREVEIKKYADEAEAAANTYTDGQVDVLEAEDERLAGLIAGNATAIGNEATARDNADKAIEAKIGEGFDSTNTVKKAIEAAATLGQSGIDKADAAQTAITNLTNGAVATNAAAIEALQTAVADEVKARGEEDTKLDNRLKNVEAFFATAEGETLDGALDTLKEIQDYLNGEGSATDGIIGRVAEAEKDIKALEDTLAEGGDFEKKVAANTAAIEANAGDIKTLQDLTSDYTGKGAIKSAIEAAHKAGTDAATAAGVADGKAVDAQTRVGVLETTIGDANSGLVQLINTVKGTADGAAAGVESLGTRMGTAEGSITSIQAIVSSGDNSNANLRAAITSLQTLTGTDGAIQTAVRAAQKTADDAASQAATNKAAIEAIQSDYLKAADELIFQCGTATTVVHVKAAN